MSLYDISNDWYDIMYCNIYIKNWCHEFFETCLSLSGCIGKRARLRLVETPGAPTSFLHVQIRNFWCYTIKLTSYSYQGNPGTFLAVNLFSHISAANWFQPEISLTMESWSFATPKTAGRGSRKVHGPWSQLPCFPCHCAYEVKAKTTH